MTGNSPAVQKHCILAKGDQHFTITLMPLSPFSFCLKFNARHRSILWGQTCPYTKGWSPYTRIHLTDDDDDLNPDFPQQMLVCSFLVWPGDSIFVQHMSGNKSGLNLNVLAHTVTKKHGLNNLSLIS